MTSTSAAASTSTPPPAPTATLWLRDGNHYYKPVEGGNHKLKPLFGLVTKEDGTQAPKKFDKGVYCLRYRVDGVGKRTWEPVGNEPQQAQVERGKKEIKLHALVNNMASAVTPMPETSLTSAGVEYLGETLAKVEAKQLARSTYTAYRRVVVTFLPFAVKAKTFEQVTRTMILSRVAWLQGERELEEYTVEKRVDMLKIFFNHYQAKWPLMDKDKPTHTPSPAKPYLVSELNQMLQHGTEDEIDVVLFFCGCGGRKGEVQHGHYTDINWERSIFLVTEKRPKKQTKKKKDDWKTKDGEEGEIPLNLILMERLRKRRERYPNTLLIFAGPRAKPNCNLLAIIKNLALRSGVNCGQCEDKHGHSCKDHPVCQRVICHRFRKNFATAEHEQGGVDEDVTKMVEAFRTRNHGGLHSGLGQ